MSKVKSTKKGNEYEVILVTEKQLNDKSLVWGYARCSTNEDRQDITRQTRELKNRGVDRIVLEYVSGAKADRSGFNYILENVLEGQSIIALEVSRITRSTAHLCDVVEIAKERKLKLDVGSLVIDCSKGEIDAMTEGMLKMMGVFAELERNMTRQRVRSGLANAKANGKVLGRKEVKIEDLPRKFVMEYGKYKNKQINVSDYAKLCEVSRPTIYRWISVYENTREIIKNK